MASVEPDQVAQRCRVCGEEAAGFHFGAFTCEGCKSFFGRTHSNASTLSACRNGGRCVVTRKTRTACKSCRLQRCLEAGMSRSSSRYGRRSNWFKMHYLQKEATSSPTTTQGKIDVSSAEKTQTLSLISNKCDQEILRLKNVQYPKKCSLSSTKAVARSETEKSNLSISIINIPERSDTYTSNQCHRSEIVSEDSEVFEDIKSDRPRKTHVKITQDSSRHCGQKICKNCLANRQLNNWTRRCLCHIKKDCTTSEVIEEQRIKETARTELKNAPLFLTQKMEVLSGQVPPICVPILPHNWLSRSYDSPCNWLSQSLLFYYNALVCHTPVESMLPAPVEMEFVTEMPICEKRTLSSVALDNELPIKHREFVTSDRVENSPSSSEVVGKDFTSPLHRSISKLMENYKNSSVVSRFIEIKPEREEETARLVKRSHNSSEENPHFELSAIQKQRTEFSLKIEKAENCSSINDSPIDLRVKKHHNQAWTNTKDGNDNNCDANQRQTVRCGDTYAEGEVGGVLQLGPTTP